MNKKPPIWPLKFFRWFCNPEFVEDIEGDLLERFEKRTEDDKPASWLLTLDVLKLCRPGIIRNIDGSIKLNHYGMFKHHLKIAYRNQVRNKSIAFINLGGLALGLLITLMIGLWVQDELSWNKDNENYDRVVRVMQKRVFNENPRVIKALPVSLAAELKENYGDVFEHVVLSSFYWDALITQDADALSVTGVAVQEDAPHVMALKMLNGSRDGLQEEAAIMLSESTARALFGDDEAMNQTVQRSEQSFIVKGVYEDFPSTSSFSKVDFLAKSESDQEANWESNNHQIFATISRHSSIKDINQKIASIINDHLPDDKKNEKNEVFLHPMKDWHLRSSWENGVQSGGGITYVRWFSLIGLLVLFLACINFMNLSTAQSIRRAKEVGIRKSIGSIRHQLVAQFMTESTLLVFCAFLLVTALSWLIVPYFNELTGKQISIPLNTWQYWVYGLGCVLVVGILSGSYPALYLSSFRPIQVLKGTYQSPWSAKLFRKAMVVFQFTISIALIIGTIVITQQIAHAVNRPLGYEGESTISIAMSSSEHYSKNGVIENELLLSGAVEDYAESFNPLTEVWMMNHDFDWLGKDPAFTPMINTLYVSPNFGNTVQWEITEGRDFSSEMSSDSSGLIINETAARIMGVEQPIGLDVDWQGNTYKVVGVVKDLLNDSPFRKTGPTYYFFGGENHSNYSLIRLNDQLSQVEAINKVSEIYERVIPNVPFEFEFVSEAHGRNFRSIERISSLTSIFSSFAILISCLGLFGLASFMVEQRSKEIGIRKVLGASMLHLWQLISQEFVALVLISSVIAVPIALWTLSGWLEGYEYRIALEWWVFVASCVGALIITVITTSFKSLTAIQLNPVKTLKDE